MRIMIRSAVIVLMGLFFPSALAQVPAGVPYEPDRHPNPIVTWVEEKDFKEATFAAAAEAVGVELMTLSADEGQRESVDLASPSPARQRIRIMNEDVEVTFYPVMRQNYRLQSGNSFVMYSFRFPRAVTTADMLNQAAFGRPPRGARRRFGSLEVPDQLEIRGNPGLYFDDGKLRTVYWFELGTAHSVTSDLSKDDLFRVLDDLL